MGNISSKNALESIIRQLSQLNNEEDWFLSKRLQAFQLLHELEKPVIERLNYSKWQLWSLTETNEIYNQRLNDASEGIIPVNSSIANFIQADTGLTGETIRNDFRTIEVDEVIVCSFSEASVKYPELFKNIYEKSAFNQIENQFGAYTLSFLTSGLFIYVPKNKQVNQAIETAFIQLNRQNNISNHQVLIYVEKNAKVEIIERYLSEESSSSAKVNIYVDLHANEGAQVNYSAIDQMSQTTTGYIYRTAKVSKDASVKWALAMMNDGNMIEDVFVNLAGSGAMTDVKGVSISHHNQVQGSNIKVINSAQNTIGHIFQHGVALEESTLTFNGIGHIIKNAKNSDAQQESRILMLSDEARADANPILLIDEYEVSAGHAAFVSRVDEEQLYYLMSRGIDSKLAEKLIIRGFLGIVLSEISVKRVHDELIETIERKLMAL